MLLSLTALQTALEVGAIYSLVALALFISFSILNIADLSTDGCYTLGFAVGGHGHPGRAPAAGPARRHGRRGLLRFWSPPFSRPAWGWRASWPASS